MNALCKLCNTNIVAVDEIQLSTLMLAHILQKHHSQPPYEKLILEITRQMEWDFTVSFDKELKK